MWSQFGCSGWLVVVSQTLIVTAMEVWTPFLLLTSTVAVDVVLSVPVWNWALGVPLHANTTPITNPVSPSLQMEQTADLLTRRHRHHHQQRSFCQFDIQCGRRMFCDVHYGICRHQRKDGEQCREDKHCFRSSECAFGLCRKKVKSGTKGAKCLSDADCDSNSCCARNHGELICRSRLPLGHKCYMPKGGLDYSINEMCPCREGLYCTYNHGNKQSEASSSSHRSVPLDHPSSIEEIRTLRCAPFPVGNFIRVV